MFRLGNARAVAWAARSAKLTATSCSLAQIFVFPFNAHHVIGTYILCAVKLRTACSLRVLDARYTVVNSSKRLVYLLDASCACQLNDVLPRCRLVRNHSRLFRFHDMRTAVPQRSCSSRVAQMEAAFDFFKTVLHSNLKLMLKLPKRAFSETNTVLEHPSLT